jgi:hypothetical protein
MARIRLKTASRYPTLSFNATALGKWADAQHLTELPLAIRILARRRNLPPWRAIAIAEISGFGGLHNDH